MEQEIVWASVFVLRDVRTNREGLLENTKCPGNRAAASASWENVSRSLCVSVPLFSFSSYWWLLFWGNGAAHLNDSCACFLHVCKSRTEAQPCPSITMTYFAQICWHHVLAGLCVCVCAEKRKERTNSS